MDDFKAVQIGLDRQKVRLVESRPEWAAVAERLCGGIRRALGDRILAVEHVGSTAVPGLLAKPILDLAATVRHGHDDIAAIREPLSQLAWRYRGDTGFGDVLFVLETRPEHRVAHLHVLPQGAREWRNYLAFRDRLRADPSARARYEAVKRSLIAEFPDDRRAYTAGKDDVVLSILSAC